MNKMDSVSSYVSNLSVKEIEDLSDEEIMAIRMERPGHKGSFGFMLNPKYFKSNEHHSQIISALIIRLVKVKK